jgi:hypothetical protein
MLLLYSAAMKQVVSAALVAEREADEEEVAAVKPRPDESESSPARLGADKPEIVQASQPDQQVVKKKMVQRPVYFVSSLLQGARSRYSRV